MKKIIYILLFIFPLLFISCGNEERDPNSMSVNELVNKGAELYDEKNHSEAIKYFKLAADQGYAPAQDQLGFAYENGYGVKQSDVEAIKYYKLSADQGYSGAQYNLGYMYENGYGVKQSDTEAIKYYKLAADQGVLDAKKALEIMKNK